MRHYPARKFTHDQALAGVEAKLRKLVNMPPPDYPLDRVPGYIIHFVNGIYTVVNLEPEGYCSQHRATFHDNSSILSGMDGIHAEIRRVMPPLMSRRKL